MTAMGAFVLTAGFVAEATTGRLVAGAAGEIFGSVSTDTRTLAADALFIALEGERFNGHDFLDVALERGATGLLIAADKETRRRGNKEASNPAHRQVSIIVVDDTLRALQALAREVRRRSGAKVVAITGSAGKTTTKEVTAELLEARFTVFRNRGNLNNHIGLPLSLLELRQGPDLAVVELGMNHAGEIRTLVGIAEPEVRVWINVGDAHIGLGQRDKPADLAGMVHAELDDGHLRLRAEFEQRQRQADVIVQVAAIAKHREPRRQQGRGDLLGGGLSCAACDRNDHRA